jgi:hypothetical protein
MIFKIIRWCIFLSRCEVYAKWAGKTLPTEAESIRRGI